MSRACNPSIWEAEAGELSQAWGQPTLQSETLSQKTKHESLSGPLLNSLFEINIFIDLDILTTTKNVLTVAFGAENSSVQEKGNQQTLIRKSGQWAIVGEVM